MELQQVELVGTEPAQRALQLRGVGCLQLGGDEDAVAQTARRHHVPQHGFGFAVGRGRVDQAAAAGEQRLHDCARFLPRLLAAAEYVEVPSPTAGKRSPLDGMARVSNSPV